jgi:hypothetical protein
MPNIILSGQILVEKWWLGTPDYDVDGVCHSDDNIYIALRKVHMIAFTERRYLSLKFVLS